MAPGRRSNSGKMISMDVGENIIFCFARAGILLLCTWLRSSAIHESMAAWQMCEMRIMRLQSLANNLVAPSDSRHRRHRQHGSMRGAVPHIAISPSNKGREARGEKTFFSRRSFSLFHCALCILSEESNMFRPRLEQLKILASNSSPIMSSGPTIQKHRC